MSSILRVDHITKKYKNGVLAVDDVSFTFDKGILGLIGPNGAGKSTLIKMIVGLISPTRGHVVLMDKKVNMQSPPLENIGILHEKPAYPSNVTLSEYLFHISNFIDADIKDIRQVCKLLEIDSYIDRKIGTLSAGMLQKFGLAESILGFPNVVIMDEPTSNLDPLNRKKVLETIKELNNNYGINFLISTHILGELERVCDTIMIFNLGKMLLYSSFDEAMCRYFTDTYRIVAKGLLAKDLKTLAKNIIKVDKYEFMVEPNDPVLFKEMLFKKLIEKNIAPDEFVKVKPTLENIFEQELIRSTKKE
ncbi:MAG: ABC transporter ATP-binding protein [Candidatus Methanofastidiosia archaeon]